MACWFQCPKCGKALWETEKTWCCDNGHTYDRSRAGYVNLLPPSGKSNHGDDKPMVQARRSFLEKGYYGCLAEAVCQTAALLAPDDCTILDAGCGEGYYTRAVYQTLMQSRKNVRMMAVDLSKNALMLAARTVPDIAWAAASVYALPVANQCADLVLDLFSPLADREYRRVLKPGGYLIYAIPLRDHLFSLKTALYERPYLNPEQDLLLDGFTLTDRKEIRREIHLTCGEDVRNLFTMTPYYHKTSPADRQKLERISDLTTQAAFGLLIYQRNFEDADGEE